MVPFRIQYLAALSLDLGRNSVDPSDQGVGIRFFVASFHLTQVSLFRPKPQTFTLP